MTNNMLNIEAYQHKDGQMVPCEILISDAVDSGDGTFYCLVKCSSFLSGEKKIFGADAEHAKEVALSFMKSLTTGVILVDKEGVPIEWKIEA